MKKMRESRTYIQIKCIAQRQEKIISIRMKLRSGSLTVLAAVLRNMCLDVGVSVITAGKTQDCRLGILIKLHQMEKALKQIKLRSLTLNLLLMKLPFKQWFQS